MTELLARLGARLGNANDRHLGMVDPGSARPAAWLALDRFAGWLYTLPERRRTR